MKKNKKGKPNNYSEKNVIKIDESPKKFNKQLRNILITMVFVFLTIVLTFLIVKSTTKFTYNGVKFEMIKEGNLILYKTSIPVIYRGEIRDYNFYLRNDARKLNVPFNGELSLRKNAVLNMEKDFKCDGKGIIGVANLVNLYQISEIKIIRDENASCDNEGRYTYFYILEGNESKIEQFGASCYNLYVKDCEILEVTERLMIETFSKINEITNKK